MNNPDGEPTLTSYGGEEEWLDTYEERQEIPYFPWWEAIYIDQIHTDTVCTSSQRRCRCSLLARSR